MDSTPPAFPLFPTPRCVQPVDGATDVDLRTCRAFQVAAGQAELARAFFGCTVEDVVVTACDTLGAFALRSSPGTAVPDEPVAERGYVLSVMPGGVSLVASDAAGFFSGLQSLWQLLLLGVPVPCGVVTDSPSVKTRSFQIDLGRQPESLAEVKRLVRDHARYHYNEVQLYLENSLKLPAFGDAADPAGLTVDEYVTLQDYAAALGVAVVPSLNLLGHMEKILRHPAFAHLSEMREGARHPNQAYAGCLCPELPETREWVARIVKEICETTRSPKLMVGLDECWTLGSHPESRKRLDAANGAGSQFREWIEFLHAEVMRGGKKMWMWEDMLFYHEGALGHIPSDIGMNIWHYQHIESIPCYSFRNWGRIDSIDTLTSLGHPAMLCCGPDLDHLHSMLRYSEGYPLDGVLVVQWEGGIQESQHIPHALAGGLLWSGVYPDLAQAAPVLTGCAASSSAEAGLALETALAPVVARGGGSDLCPRFWSWPENARARREALVRVRAWESLPVDREAVAVSRALAIGAALHATVDWVRETTALAGRRMLQRQLARSMAFDEAVGYLEALMPRVQEVQGMAERLAERYWPETPDRREGKWLAAMAEAPQTLLARLKRFRADPCGRTWPYAAISLHLDGLALDPCAHHVELGVSEDGDNYTEVFAGNARLNIPDGPFIMSFPLQAVPRFVRLAVGGFASLAFTRVRLETLDGTCLASRVEDVSGTVSDPEHLLVFDQKIAIFNPSDVLSNWLSLTPPESNRVVLAFDSEGENP